MTSAEYSFLAKSDDSIFDSTKMSVHLTKALLAATGFNGTLIWVYPEPERVKLRDSYHKNITI